MEININEIASAKIKQMEESGEIRKRIEDGVEKTINEAIDSACKSYEFRNGISENVKGLLGEVAKSVNFSAYANFLKDRMNEQIEKYVKNDMINLMRDSFGKMYFNIPENIKLSDILNKYREHLEKYLDADDKREWGYIKFFFEKEYSCFIKIEAGCPKDTMYSIKDKTLNMSLYIPHSVIETVCSDLEREGYSVQPIVIPACAVGAPHRRDRVLFIAHRTDAGAEAMQREGTDGVCVAGAAAPHPMLPRERSIPHLQPQQSDGPGIDGIGGERYAAHADGERCNHGSYNRGERHIRTDQEQYSKENKPERTERKHRSGKDGTAIFAGNAAYADIYRLQTFRVTQRNDSEEWSYKERCAEKHPGNDGATLPADRWKNFPTQPPVCRRDDELSARLDGITFSKWRQESVKAYGNAVVPALVVEIFKDIEQQYQ